MYAKRCKMDPFWNSVLLGGYDLRASLELPVHGEQDRGPEPFLGMVDMHGTPYESHILATGFPGEAVGPTGDPLPLNVPPGLPLMRLATLDLDQVFVHFDFNGAKVKRLLAEHPDITDALHGRPPLYLLRSLRPDAQRVRPLLANYSIETAAQYIARSREGLNILRSAAQPVPV